MLTMPLFTDTPSVQMIVGLDGQSFQITYTWNVRTSSWYMDVATADGTRVLSGVRLQHRWSAWARYHAIDELPLGEAVCFSMTDDSVDPSLESFGRDTILMYYAQAEVEDAPTAPLGIIVEKI